MTLCKMECVQTLKEVIFEGLGHSRKGMTAGWEGSLRTRHVRFLKGEFP